MSSKDDLIGTNPYEDRFEDANLIAILGADERGKIRNKAYKEAFRDIQRIKRREEFLKELKAKAEDRKKTKIK